MKKELLITLAAMLILSGNLSVQADSVYGFAPAPSYTNSTQNTQNYYGTSSNSTTSSVYGFSPAPTYNYTPVNTQSQTSSSNSVYGFSPAYEQKPVNNYSTPSYTSGNSNYTNYTNQYKQQTNTNYSNKNAILMASEPKKFRESISTTNYANSSVEFYYYIPPVLVNQTDKPFPVIIWVPGLDGNGEESIPNEFYTLADRNGYGILSPTFRFNQEDFDQQKSYQYPAAWSGNALVNMLNQAKNNGFNYSKLYMAGFSAGGQFVSRFSFINPDLVAACALLSSGARVKPSKNTGVKYFIGIGSKDTEYRLQNAEIFNTAVKNLGIPHIYKKYDMDHETTDEEMNDVTKFFEQVRKGTL